MAVIAVFLILVTSSPGAIAALGDEASYSSQHFTITWPTDPDDPSTPLTRDRDDDGVPDKVEKLVRIFESARAFEVNVLGLQPPPNDDDYPLYVNPGAQTVPLPGDTDSRPSYILVRPDLLQAGSTTQAMRTFAAHEYAHAIEMGYDRLEDHWIDEATATWMEGAFSPRAVPNLGALEFFLPYQRESLTSSFETHHYGAFVFLQFLFERYAAEDLSGIRDLWVRMAVPGVNSVQAITEWLASRAVTVPDMWREFTLWNWELGRYESGVAYRRAVEGKWPLARSSTEVLHESCRLTSNGGSPLLLPPLSSDYVQLVYPRAVRANGYIRIQAPPEGVATAIVTFPTRSEVVPLTFGADGLATITGTFGLSAISKVVLILGNAASSGPPVSFVYSSILEGAEGSDAGAPSGPASVTFGYSTVLSGTVRCNGSPAPFVRLALVETLQDGRETRYPLVADQGGNWGQVVYPDREATYRVVLDDPWISTATSDPYRIQIMPFVSIALQSDQVTLGSPARLDGTLTPAHSTARIALEFRRPAGVWRLGTSVLTSSEGAYTGDIVLPNKGVWELRARITDTNDSDHIPGVSLSQTVVVAP
jgi:hypothetical protein